MAASSSSSWGVEGFVLTCLKMNAYSHCSFVMMYCKCRVEGNSQVLFFTFIINQCGMDVDKVP